MSKPVQLLRSDVQKLQAAQKASANDARKVKTDAGAVSSDKKQVTQDRDQFDAHESALTKDRTSLTAARTKETKQLDGFDTQEGVAAEERTREHRPSDWRRRPGHRGEASERERRAFGDEGHG